MKEEVPAVDPNEKDEKLEKLLTWFHHITQHTHKYTRRLVSRRHGDIAL